MQAAMTRTAVVLTSILLAMLAAACSDMHPHEGATPTVTIADVERAFAQEGIQLSDTALFDPDGRTAVVAAFIGMDQWTKAHADFSVIVCRSIIAAEALAFPDAAPAPRETEVRRAGRTVVYFPPTVSARARTGIERALATLRSSQQRE
jgi:hypothetical protein